MKRNSGILKRNLIGFLIGIITSGSISVIAATYFPSNDVTYDNSVSGLESTNVQGAIDELYGVCTAKPAGEQIIENAGLEKDLYENRYFFTGANPNNYITFNGETAGWRIISIEADGSIKIMRDESIESYAWDTSSSNNWARPATLNTYLNGTYFNSLSLTAQDQIESHDWSIGPITYSNNDIKDQVNDEQTEKWTGMIALPTLSEYIRTNSNVSQCGTHSLNQGNSSTCKNSTWMYKSNISYWWTLSPGDGLSNIVFDVSSNGGVYTNNVGNKFDGVRPALYLSSSIKITGGTGTASDPYTIE